MSHSNKSSQGLDYFVGINPPENKSQSLGQKIQLASLPNTLTIAVALTNDDSTDILVEVGDQVLKGQPIARSKNRTGITQHASSSGIISSISKYPMPNGTDSNELCVRIETDGKEQLYPQQSHDDYLQLSPEELIEIIVESGICGLGGAGFPTHRKLDNGQNIHTLIINACECEPYISADEALIREHAEDIIVGIQILLQVLKPQHCMIGIEESKPDTISVLKSALQDERIQLCEVANKYPMGAEKQLIQALTGKEVSSGCLPVELGIVCQNVATVHAIARAVRDGEPLISRITTLTGAALESPGNWQVLIGTPMSELLNACGFKSEIMSALIMGGPLMGIRLPSIHLPIVKTSNCLIAATVEELPPALPEQACIRCGACVEACPMQLLPQQLFWSAQSKDFALARQLNLLDCIECGACTYVCPSHIPLVQHYRGAKASLRAEDDKHVGAERAKQRFEYRQLRMERDKVEADRRRLVRAQLAKKKGSGGAKDAIREALARVKAKKKG